ncbi:MAG: thioredoxin domain-containing protein [Myxococcota bacterium]
MADETNGAGGSRAGAAGSGGATIAAALVVALAVLGAGWWVADAVARATDAMGDLELAVADLSEQLDGAQRGAAPSQARAARPSDDRRYEVRTEGAPSWGPETAKVTVVEFSDFECPYCARVYPTLQRLRQEYGDDLRVVFKHLPLPMHRRARGAHAAAIAADRQGRFWEMHNRMFEHQRLLSDAQYADWAREIGLDVDAFEAARTSSEVAATIDRDLAEAEALGVSGTPAFFINGRFLSGAQPYASFKRVVDEALGSEG